MPEKRQKQSPVLKLHRSLLNVHNLQPSGFMESSGPYLFTSDLARQRLEGTRKLRVRRSLPGQGSFSLGRPWRWSPEGLWAPGKGKPAPSQSTDISQSVGAPPTSACLSSFFTPALSRGELWVFGGFVQNKSGGNKER